MLDPLPLNAAAKHQIGHAHIGTIHYTETDGTVTSKTIGTIKDIRVHVAGSNQVGQLISRVSVSREVHLVGALSQLVDALNVLLVHLADLQLQTTVFQERKVFSGEFPFSHLAPLLIAVERPPLPTLLGHRALTIRPIE